MRRMWSELKNFDFFMCKQHDHVHILVLEETSKELRFGRECTDDPPHP